MPVRILALAAVGMLLSPVQGEKVSWGAGSAGLRLGLSLNGSLPDSSLELTLQNGSSTEQRVYIARGMASQFQFIATAGDGKEYPILDRNLFLPSAGLVLPVVETIAAGASHEYSFPLTRLIQLPKKGPYLTLDVLLQRGCSVRAYLDASEDKLTKDLGRTPNDVWIGRVDSGEVRSE